MLYMSLLIFFLYVFFVTNSVCCHNFCQTAPQAEGEKGIGVNSGPANSDLWSVGSDPGKKPRPKTWCGVHPLPQTQHNQTHRQVGQEFNSTSVQCVHVTLQSEMLKVPLANPLVTEYNTSTHSDSRNQKMVIQCSYPQPFTQNIYI